MSKYYAQLSSRFCRFNYFFVTMTAGRYNAAMALPRILLCLAVLSSVCILSLSCRKPIKSHSAETTAATTNVPAAPSVLSNVTPSATASPADLLKRNSQSAIRPSALLGTLSLSKGNPQWPSAPKQYVKTLCQHATQLLLATPRHAPALFNQGLREMADDGQTMTRCGDISLARGDYYRSQIFFRRAVQLNEHDLDALAGLATVLTATNQHERAIGIYQKIIDLTTLQLTAGEDMNAGAVAGAVAAEFAATRTDKTSVQSTLTSARFNQAVAHWRLGELTQAERLFSRILQDDPGHLKAQFNLATLHSAQGRLAQAKEAWTNVTSQAAIMGDNDAAEAWSSLGAACMDLGQGDEALAAYSQACERKGDDATNWLNLAVAAEAAGRFGTAIAACKRACKLSPQSDDAFLRLGNVLLAAHRATNKKELLAEALEAWRQSLKLNGHQPDLVKLLDKYQQVHDLAAASPASQSQPAR